MDMINLTTMGYCDVFLLLRRSPYQSLQETDRPRKLKPVRTVAKAIEILGGVTVFLQRSGAKYKAVSHWQSLNRFPANMTCLVETMLNECGYAPVFKILTQIPVDTSEEMELIERLAATR